MNLLSALRVLHVIPLEYVDDYGSNVQPHFCRCRCMKLNQFGLEYFDTDEAENAQPRLWQAATFVKSVELAPLTCDIFSPVIIEHWLCPGRKNHKL